MLNSLVKYSLKNILSEEYLMDQDDFENQIATGISGLDEVLLGGIRQNGIYLVEGEAGTGKTTLGLQFLLEGARQAEDSLYIALSEGEKEIQAMARSHGWSLDGITIFELLHFGEQIGPDAQYTMFHPSEVELSESTQKIFQAVERSQAKRVVVDSLSEMRMMAQNPLWFRRQILALKKFFAAHGCTALFLEEHVQQYHIRTLVDGVIHLDMMAPEYGGHRRRLRILKRRGKDYQGGNHDYNIAPGGLKVFPRLIAQEHSAEFVQETVTSGLAELDALTGGGLTRGSSTLIMGTSGTGKSSVASRYLFSFLVNGEKAALFLFDETIENYLMRSRGLGMDLQPHLENDRLLIKQVDPAELTPGEFAAAVRQAVDQGASMVVIDSLSGYLQAMSEERFLILHMHELLTFLAQRGVTTLSILTQHGLVGSQAQSPADLSFLSDSVLLLRHFETEGELRKAILVVKKRTGEHELVMRELKFGGGRMRIGEPLRQFRGVLTGNPVFQGNTEALMGDDE